jgi:hypothetical protein
MRARPARIDAAFWTPRSREADAACMAVVALALAVLLVGQDVVLYVNRPRR